jgi:hypothetical protein
MVGDLDMGGLAVRWSVVDGLYERRYSSVLKAPTCALYAHRVVDSWFEQGGVAAGEGHRGGTGGSGCRRELVRHAGP